MPSDVQVLKLQGDGVTLVADARGSRADPPVVLAHGGGQTRHAWGTTAARLAAGGRYALTVDLRGHGDSDWAPDGDYELDRYAADLRAIVSQLSQPPTLVGASLGGISSLVAIAEAPDPAMVASALVLVDVAPRIELAGVARIRQFMTGRPDGFASLEEVADAVAAYNPHRRRPQDLSGLRKNVRQRLDGRFVWHWDPRMLGNESDEPKVLRHQSRLESDARLLRLPTLLVRGAMSDLLSEQGARHLHELVPHAELVDVAGAGHMVAGDRNDAFNDAIIEFLDRVLPIR